VAVVAAGAGTSAAEGPCAGPVVDEAPGVELRERQGRWRLQNCPPGVLGYPPGFAARSREPRPLNGGSPLRVEWETDPPREGLQAVCGRVLNDQSVTAWNVVLLVEALDGKERVTNSRQVDVLVEVPPEGYAVFCVPEPAGATTYRVRVIGADWLAPQSP
jgi:hypothetical protein